MHSLYRRDIAYRISDATPLLIITASRLTGYNIEVIQVSFLDTAAITAASIVYIAATRRFYHTYMLHTSGRWMLFDAAFHFILILASAICGAILRLFDAMPRSHRRCAFTA